MTPGTPSSPNRACFRAQISHYPTVLPDGHFSDFDLLDKVKTQNEEKN